jgi:hypothetical protein
MSFQETLVSKKQKQTKKNTQNVQKNQNCKKKQRLPTSASLIAITTTKRD